MLRGGTNYLRIERGRWVGEREDERVCKVCLCEDVEDEKHFLLACPMYVRERIDMFDKIKEECKLEYIENMDEDFQLNILIGIGWKNKEKETKKIVIESIRKANEIRNKYV